MIRRLRFWNASLLVLFFSLVTGCSDDATPVYGEFTNLKAIAGVHQSGDILKVEIFAHAEKGNLNQIKLSSYDVQYGTRLCLDSLISCKDLKFTYEYAVPYFSKDSVRLDLQLEITNTQGDRSFHTAPLLVTGSGRGVLNEYAGLLLYGGKSTRPNALDLNSPTQTFCLATADTAQVSIDIYAYAAQDDDTETLSCEWRTATDVDFVRFNGFDYVNATALSLETLYNTSHRTNAIRDIRQGDIIVVGKDASIWGVFQVALCYDQEGVDDDGYLLNFKRIE
ncbi:MAG: hypothetical protein KBT20_00400 [Bacteroidales bacterium]|nr:hypothetical protein [Candidatus Liminaster caballi]